MERENINRGLGWLFMTTGRRLERAIYLTRQLREITAPSIEQYWTLLECLLEVADSSMTYRARYYTTLQPLAVLDVLMADESNPRSLDFQLSHLADLYQKLPRHLPADLRAMRNAVALFAQFDLRELKYPLPGTGTAASRSDGIAQLAAFLRELEGSVAILVEQSIQPVLQPRAHFADHDRMMTYKICSSYNLSIQISRVGWGTTWLV